MKSNDTLEQTLQLIELIFQISVNLKGKAHARLYTALIHSIHENALEPIIESVLKKSGKKVCLDIGANQGHYTQVFSNIIKKNGTIYLYEPIPDHARKLKKLFSKNENIHIKNIALGIRSGIADFYHYKDTELTPNVSGASGLTPNSSYLITPERIKVKIKTLDSFKLEKIDFIKIDTEGSEIDILRGGSETIKKTRPVISVEHVHYGRHGHKESDIFLVAEELDYDVYTMFGNNLSKQKEKKLIENKLNILCNIILIPKENKDKRLIEIMGKNKKFIFKAINLIKERVQPNAENKICILDQEEINENITKKQKLEKRKQFYKNSFKILLVVLIGTILLLTFIALH